MSTANSAGLSCKLSCLGIGMGDRPLRKGVRPTLVADILRVANDVRVPAEMSVKVHLSFLVRIWLCQLCRNSGPGRVRDDVWRRMIA